MEIAPLSPALQRAYARAAKQIAEHDAALQNPDRLKKAAERIRSAISKTMNHRKTVKKVEIAQPSPALLKIADAVAQAFHNNT